MRSSSNPSAAAAVAPIALYATSVLPATSPKCRDLHYHYDGRCIETQLGAAPPRPCLSAPTSNLPLITFHSPPPSPRDRSCGVVRYRTQSLGKTMIASMIGVAVEQGKLDIDRPIIEYGVSDTAANWSVFGTSFYPNVTTRHLLGQSSGYGMVAPGTKFTYDSGDYIQYLSYVLEAATGQPAVAFASREFAAPLGVPDLFAYDGQIYGIGANISTGGGQMMTCLDMARVGQLIVNRGVWRGADGRPTQLSSRTYMEQMGRPSFPEFNSGYGFLTWLNAKVAPGAKHCCAPRWSTTTQLVNQTVGNEVRHGVCCAARNGSGAIAPPCDLREIAALSEGVELMRGQIRYEGDDWLESSIIDDSTPAGELPAPHDLMLGQGLDGMYMFVIPSLNVTVVTMGSSRPTSSKCVNSYDDSWLPALAWNAMSKALVPAGDPSPEPPPVPVSMPAPPAAATSARPEHPDRPTVPVGHLGAHTVVDEIAGSCTCDCPMNMGYGYCFDVPPDALPLGATISSTSTSALWPPPSKCMGLKRNSTVSMKIHRPADYCPALGKTISCDPSKDTNATALCNPPGGHSTRRAVWCEPVRGCGSFPGMSDAFAVATCSCPVRSASFEPCVWSDSPCVYSPYYLPG